MLPTVDDIRHSLEVQGYSWHEGFSHRSIAPFIRRYFFRLNPVVVAYWTAQLTVFGIAVLFWFNSGYSLVFLLSFLAGMACLVFLIPLHEWVHGIGYKWAGAHRVEYRVHWKYFVFIAIADRFVTRKWPFVLLALAPFFVINTLLVLLMAVLPPYWLPWISGALFMHVAGCSGDFALLSYFYTYWGKDPVTFDDAGKGESHFFIRA